MCFNIYIQSESNETSTRDHIDLGIPDLDGVESADMDSFPQHR